MSRMTRRGSRRSRAGGRGAGWYHSRSSDQEEKEQDAEH